MAVDSGVNKPGQWEKPIRFFVIPHPRESYWTSKMSDLVFESFGEFAVLPMPVEYRAKVDWIEPERFLPIPGEGYTGGAVPIQISSIFNWVTLVLEGKPNCAPGENGCPMNFTLKGKTMEGLDLEVPLSCNTSATNNDVI